MDLLAKDVIAALPSTLGAAAIAPSMLVLWTIASMDNRREPARVVLATFLFGAGSAFLLSYLRDRSPEFPSSRIGQSSKPTSTRHSRSPRRRRRRSLLCWSFSVPVT